MTPMPAKGVFISRLLGYLFAISMLFLILSSSSLLFQNGDYSYIKHDDELVEPKSTLFVASSGKEPCFKSNPNKPTTLCDQNQNLLKVFMYDLPLEFHFGLLGWKGDRNQIWPNVSNMNEIPKYPGGLNLQHSIEYWLTLDLLSSVVPNVSRPSTAILVKNSTQADVLFVPFFSSLSYNHPNSMLLARKHLGSAILVLADFGRYPLNIANTDKDIIAPYKHVVRFLRANDSPSFEDRPLLVYFQGAIYRKNVGSARRLEGWLLLNSASTLQETLLHLIVCLMPLLVIVFLMKLLRRVQREKWIEMWERLKQIAPFFEYRYPSQPGDAVDMIWQAVHRRVSFVHNIANRRNRYLTGNK